MMQKKRKFDFFDWALLLLCLAFVVHPMVDYFLDVVKYVFTTATLPPTIIPDYSTLSPTQMVLTALYGIDFFVLTFFIFRTIYILHCALLLVLRLFEKKIVFGLHMLLTGVFMLIELARDVYLLIALVLCSSLWFCKANSTYYIFLIVNLLPILMLGLLFLLTLFMRLNDRTIDGYGSLSGEEGG